MEQLEVVNSSISILDTTTAIHMLCYSADIALKKQVQTHHDQVNQDDVMFALIFNTGVYEQLPNLRSQDLGAILWSLATVSSSNSTSNDGSSCNGSNTWKYDIVEYIASFEASHLVTHNKVSSYNTKELFNILFAIGALCQIDPPPPPGAATPHYLLEMMQEADKRLTSQPYVKGSLSAKDYTDIVSITSRLYCQKTEPLPPVASQLMNTVASEVRRQLANKHSARSAFVPRELARFLSSYSTLQLKTAPVASLFDACSGFVCSRIRSRHLNAVTRPQDIQNILDAYATQQHRSVAVPELLTAINEQLRRNAAQEMPTASKSNAPNFHCSISMLTSILDSHKSLGYCPDALTLTSLLPDVRRGLEEEATREEDVVRLMGLMVDFDFCPGVGMVELMVARVVGDAALEAAAEEYAEKMLMR